MSTDLLKEQNKSKEELLKELKIVRAELRVLEEAREARQRLEKETELLKILLVAVNSSKDLNSALEIVLREICEATKWVIGQVWIVSKDKAYLECMEEWYSSIKGLEGFHTFSKHLRFNKGEGLPGKVWLSKKPFWEKNFLDGTKYPRAEVAEKTGIKTAFGVPIIVRDEVIAVLEFFTLESKDEDAQFVSLVSAVANQINILIERRATEEAFQLSKKNYEALINSVDGMVWEANGETFDLTFVSKQTESMLGYPLELWTKEKNFWRNHIHPDDRERVVLYHEKETQALRAHEFEYRMIKTDGNVIWLKDIVSVIVDDNASVKIIGLTIDITKTKELEIKSRDLFERFSGIFNSSKDAIGFAALDGTLLNVNDSFLKLTGYKKEELVSCKRYQDITPDEYFEFEAMQIEGLLKTGAPVEYEKEYIKKDGSRVPILLTTFCLKDSSGKVKWLAAIIKDITERKKAENELRRLNKILGERVKESEEKYRLLVEQLPVVTYLAKPEVGAGMLYISPQVKDVLGYTQEEWLRDNTLWASRIHPEDQEETFNEYNKNFLSKEFFTFEYRFLRPDNKIVWIEERVKVLRDVEKKPLFVQGILVDISAAKQAQQELKDSEEKYKKLVKAANDAVFVADVETGIIIEANEKAGGLLGIPQNQIIGMHQSALHPKEDAEYYKAVFKDHIEKGSAIAEDLYICRSDGEKIPVEISASVMEISGRKVVQGIFRDLTQWKHTIEVKSLLASIVESSYNAIAGWTLDGINISWNKAAEKIFGYTQEEIRGKHISMLVPKDRQRELEVDFERIKNGQQLKDFATVILKKDGTQSDVFVTASPIYDAGGRIIGVSGITQDITDRKQAEKALSQLSAIVKYSATGIIGTDLTGVVFSWNPGAERIYGYTASEMIGESIAKIMPQETRSEIPSIIEKIKQGSRLEHYETTRIRKGGEKIYVSIDVAPIRNTKGEINGISSIVRDITKRKVAERELAEVQRKLTALINNLPGIAYRCLNDPGWTMEYLSEGCYSLTGYKPEELIGSKVISYNSIILKEDRNYVWETVQKGIEKKEPYILEYRITAKSGDLKWVWEKGTAIYGANGEVLALEGFINDITERREAELTRSRLASIVESSNEVIVSDTLDGTILSWNRAAERIYGYKADEIIGKHFSILVPPERLGDVNLILERVRNGESTESYETVRVRKDGKRLHVSITVSPIKDERGNIVGISAIGRDITEQKKLQAELEKIKQKELHEKEIRSLDELTSSPRKQDVAAQLFQINPIRKSMPGIFNDLVSRYEKLVEKTLDGDDLRHIISEELRFMGEELSTLKAGPSDVMEIHSTVMKQRNKLYSLEDVQKFTEKARVMVLELMGYMVTYYRKQSLIPRANGAGSGVHIKK